MWGGGGVRRHMRSHQTVPVHVFTSCGPRRFLHAHACTATAPGLSSRAGGGGHLSRSVHALHLQLRAHFINGSSLSILATPGHLRKHDT